jgi:hypothetical protein
LTLAKANGFQIFEAPISTYYKGLRNTSKNSFCALSIVPTVIRIAVESRPLGILWSVVLFSMIGDYNCITIIFFSMGQDI